MGENHPSTDIFPDTSLLIDYGSRESMRAHPKPQNSEIQHIILSLPKGPLFCGSVARGDVSVNYEIYGHAHRKLPLNFNPRYFRPPPCQATAAIMRYLDSTSKCNFLQPVEAAEIAISSRFPRKFPYSTFLEEVANVVPQST